jgi:hypothetical protein
VRFHDLRHTFGIEAVQVLPLTDVQAIMGHTHISTTMRYIHDKPGHDEGAKLTAAFRARRRRGKALARFQYEDFDFAGCPDAIIVKAVVVDVHAAP